MHVLEDSRLSWGPVGGRSKPLVPEIGQLLKDERLSLLATAPGKQSWVVNITGGSRPTETSSAARWWKSLRLNRKSVCLYVGSLDLYKNWCVEMSTLLQPAVVGSLGPTLDGSRADPQVPFETRSADESFFLVPLNRRAGPRTEFASVREGRGERQRHRPMERTGHGRRGCWNFCSLDLCL